MMSASILWGQNTHTQNLRFSANGVNFEMIFVEGSTFVMGCTSEQGACDNDETPTISVNLSDFYIGKYLVTQKLWQAVMGTTIKQQRDLAGNGLLVGKGDKFPMYYINYEECEAFCAKLNTLLAKQLPEGYAFCLPTEPQWEYAARGGTKSKGYRYSGSDDMDEVGWYNGNSGSRTHEVGTKTKNELGIYDMSGNVWEWCQDWHRSYGSNSQSNPKDSNPILFRVLRGGGWNNNASRCRVANRGNDYPIHRSGTYGFRLVLSTPHE